MRRICTTAAATALLVFLLSAASVAHASKLNVRAVSAPRSATAGLSVEVQALIGPKGRTPAAKVQ